MSDLQAHLILGQRNLDVLLLVIARGIVSKITAAKEALGKFNEIPSASSGERDYGLPLLLPLLLLFKQPYIALPTESRQICSP